MPCLSLGRAETAVDPIGRPTVKPIWCPFIDPYQKQDDNTAAFGETLHSICRCAMFRPITNDEIKKSQKLNKVPA
jgi:hypothetical protein